MQFFRANLDDCAQVTGLAVAIDVLRAFTTAGYLFSAGVERILLVSGVDEAFADACRAASIDWLSLKPQMRESGRYHVETY